VAAAGDDLTVEHFCVERFSGERCTAGNGLATGGKVNGSELEEV
jgi:hypothetical protein